ncbi:MAG: 50S ribosomal protein L23 [Clostridia bacterium]|nr:50S ribosomal protein L23 [Clostridia bacterium]MBQ7789467.1 50S ribosomal protein L23 [Clostridia bacterium]
MKFAQDIILKPIITEKSMDGISSKRYTFKVAQDATKPEIAKAVEELFGVKVAKVNTINMKKKPKRLGYHFGYTAEWKKAIVTLDASSKEIEFFNGLN